jgi:hypothetical protein
MKANIRPAMAILVALATVSLPITDGNAQTGDQNNIKCGTIRADLEWQGTGITVNPTEFICVSARGLWSHGLEVPITPFYGPRGYAKNGDNPGFVAGFVARVGALVAKIGDNAAFVVEDQLCFIPNVSGELMLSMNDIPGAFGNNVGVMNVQIDSRPLSSISPDMLSSEKLIRQRCFNQPDH